jgi:hypothetical protein
MDNLRVCPDTSGFHEPLAYRGGDVTGNGIDAAGELRGVEAAGGAGTVGAFFGVVGALDDVAADAG